MLKTKFRRTRCICNHGTKYEAIKDCVITADGKKHIIQQMSNGTEYFTIDNPYKDDLMGRAFIGCIADAIKSIQEDYADVLLGGSHTNVFTKGDYPIVLLDRVKGEAYREKFKDGWKDTKFGWGIEYGGKNSFAGYRMVDENGLVDIFGERKPKVYATKEDAEKQFEEWHKAALDCAKEFVEIFGDKEKEESVIVKTCKDGHGIVEDLFFDMIHIEEKQASIVEDVRNLENIGWSIIQAVA